MADRSHGATLLARRVVTFAGALETSFTMKHTDGAMSAAIAAFTAELTRAALADPTLAAAIFDVGEHLAWSAEREAELHELRQKRAREHDRRSAAQVNRRAHDA